MPVKPCPLPYGLACKAFALVATCSAKFASKFLIKYCYWSLFTINYREYQVFYVFKPENTIPIIFYEEEVQIDNMPKELQKIAYII